MSSLNIEIIGIEVKPESKGKNNWEVATITFKDTQFKKVDAKKVVSFSVDPPSWELLKNTKKGDFLSIDREKSEPDAQGRQYWNWKQVHRQDGVVGQQTTTSYLTGSAQPAKIGAVRAGNWETPEERAQRQVMIIRQSSISSAVDLCKDHGKQPDVEQVLHIAKQFENFVMGTGIDSLTNDEVE